MRAFREEALLPNSLSRARGDDTVRREASTETSSGRSQLIFNHRRATVLALLREGQDLMRMQP